MTVVSWSPVRKIPAGSSLVHRLQSTASVPLLSLSELPCPCDLAAKSASENQWLCLPVQLLHDIVLNAQFKDAITDFTDTHLGNLAFYRIVPRAGTRLVRFDACLNMYRTA